MTTHICIAPSEVVQALQPSPSTEVSQVFLRLPHPRTNLPALFLATSRAKDATSSEDASTILEAQAIAPDFSRSWFTGDNRVLADGKLLMFTPIDPIFLLIRILEAVQPEDKSLPGQFKPMDDIFEEAAIKLNPLPEEEGNSKSSTSPVVSTQQDILAFGLLECVRRAMERICDFKEISEDLIVYRFSQPKLISMLRLKVTRLSDQQAFSAFKTLTRGLARDGVGEDLGPSKETLREAARCRAACNVISQYLPDDIHSALMETYDLKDLTLHLQRLKTEEAAATASVQAKESADKAAKSAAAKQAKAKPAVASRGVAQLGKADIGGMSKLSTFFTKKETTKKETTK